MWFHVLFSNLPSFGAVIAQKFGAVIVRCKEGLRRKRSGLTPTLCLNASSTTQTPYLLKITTCCGGNSRSNEMFESPEDRECVNRLLRQAPF